MFTAENADSIASTNTAHFLPGGYHKAQVIPLCAILRFRLGKCFPKKNNEL